MVYKHKKGGRDLKLHDILYGIGFCCVLIGMAGVDGWMFNGTSLLVPIALILAGALILVFARKGDQDVSGI